MLDATIDQELDRLYKMAVAQEEHSLALKILMTRKAQTKVDTDFLEKLKGTLAALSIEELAFLIKAIDKLAHQEEVEA